ELKGTEKVELVITAVVKSDAKVGKYTNTATIKGTDPEDPGKEITPDEPVTEEITVGSAETTKTTNLTTDENRNVTEAVRVGQKFKYYIDVVNNTKYKVSNIEITDDVPSQLDIVSVDPETAYSGAGNKIKHTISELNPGDQFRLTIEVVVNQTAVKGQSFKNVVLVDGEEIPGPEIDVAELELKKESNIDKNHTVDVGDEFTYTLTATNTGDIVTKSVVFYDDVPSQLDVVKVTLSDGGTATVNGNVIKYIVPEIKSGETFTMTIEVKVNDTAKRGDIVKNIGKIDGKDVPDREIEVVTPPTYPWIWGGDFDKENHYAYMVGYPDGTVRPQGEITRAEVTTIFFRMMTEDSRDRYWSSENDFSDVLSSGWYNNAISTMNKAGAINGYPDGSFKPDASITRGEFATMASRFLSDNGNLTNNKFTDIKGNWA
ncbi:MAG: DUF11 domain-containing protein, partial [Tissierellia bacterium]|nr:DUF11 domain-containing protein [Tissierellia bacterium]